MSSCGKYTGKSRLSARNSSQYIGNKSYQITNMYGAPERTCENVFLTLCLNIEFFVQT